MANSTPGGNTNPDQGTIVYNGEKGIRAFPFVRDRKRPTGKALTAADFYVRTTSSSETIDQVQSRYRANPATATVYLPSEVENIIAEVGGTNPNPTPTPTPTPTPDATIIRDINTVKAWITQVSMSRDASSLDTSIGFKTVTANLPLEVKLVRTDGIAVSGDGFTSGVWRAVDLQSALNYSIAPLSSVSRFNKKDGTGVTAGAYVLSIRQTASPNTVLEVPFTAGSSQGMTPIASTTSANTVSNTPSSRTPQWLRQMGWNRDTTLSSSTYGDTNILYSSTEELEIMIRDVNGAVVSGLALSTPDGYNTKWTGDAYIPGNGTYNARLRVTSGLKKDVTYLIYLRRVSTPAEVVIISLPITDSAGIHAITLPNPDQTDGTVITPAPAPPNQSNAIATYARSAVVAKQPRLKFVNPADRMDLVVTREADGQIKVVDRAVIGAEQNRAIVVRIDYGEWLSAVPQGPYEDQMPYLIQKALVDTTKPDYLQLPEAIWLEANQIVYS